MHTILWPKFKFENDLPSMEPVLTDVTLNHESCHIIWQATQAVHWHRCHFNVCVCKLAVFNVKMSKMYFKGNDYFKTTASINCVKWVMWLLNWTISLSLHFQISVSNSNFHQDSLGSLLKYRRKKNLLIACWETWKISQLLCRLISNLHNVNTNQLFTQ